MNSEMELDKKDESFPSPGERVFQSWELVMNIFSYLPWSEVCRLRNLSAETRYACQYSVHEITDPEDHNIEENDFYDFLLALGSIGCHKLNKIDVLSSPNLSNNILPILKFCGNIEHLALTKNHGGQDIYMSMIYNTDVRHLAIQATEVHYFQDVDLIDILLILQNITELEITNAGITDIALAEISDEITNLTHLNISGCIDVTDVGLREILDKCKELKHLNVQNTPTMREDCVQAFIFNYTLEYFNALETNLLPDDAQRLKRHFDAFHRPYEFLWSRTKVVNQTYELETVREVNRRPLFTDFPPWTNEEIFNSMHIDEHLWNNAETITRRPVEFTAQQYLINLRNACNQPVFNPSTMVIHDWSEQAFKGGPKDWWSSDQKIDSLARKLKIKRSDPKLKETDEYKKIIEDENFRVDKVAFPEENNSKFGIDGILGNPDDTDLGWKRIYEVQDNLKSLKKEYEVLMEEFQTFEQK
uniref:F-box domain-containing protein n=1 Tax=Clytia hemisphaerica TaxID=252671 RepID=A0A7M5UWK4_9CNID|eukprot:TCONS_00073046-protein